MSKISDLEKLNQLLKQGAISQKEFDRLKAETLAKRPLADSPGKSKTSYDKVDEWSMFLHLSQLLNFGLPPLGLIAPIVMWLMKKNDSDLIDQHGRNALNWILSSLLYSIISMALTIVLIGYLMLLVLFLLGLIYPIKAALEARKGRVWRYPFAIPLF